MGGAPSEDPLNSEIFHLPLEPLGPEESPAPKRGLPASYGTERLALLPRDPWWAFAYWEIDERRLKGNPLGELRLYFEETGELALSVPCDLGARRFYVKAPHAGRRYYAELGLKPTLDTFRPLLRSNAAALPHGQAAERGDLPVSSLELLGRKAG